jgi:hypothetical protein
MVSFAFVGLVLLVAVLLYFVVLHFRILAVHSKLRHLTFPKSYLPIVGCIPAGMVVCPHDALGMCGGCMSERRGHCTSVVIV